ncbi:MAG: hypothetical protein KF744_01520 [Taibaiella sp.]|nr:hypothetical protein [Taibaiella sp.]
MKKLSIFILALCLTVVACDKKVAQPLSYTVESTQNKPMGDTYISDNGTYTLSVLVKFLTGDAGDKVNLKLTGLPAGVATNTDSFSQEPTYRADFKLTMTNAPHGTYPITISTDVRGVNKKTFKFNLIVRSADCAANLWGNFNGSNECTGRTFTYTATGVSTGATNELDITNLGGYGENTTTRVILDCDHNTLTIPSQNIGNGTVVQGDGTFNGNSMHIVYHTTYVSGAAPEDCAANLTR